MHTDLTYEEVSALMHFEEHFIQKYQLYTLSMERKIACALRGIAIDKMIGRHGHSINLEQARVHFLKAHEYDPESTLRYNFTTETLAITESELSFPKHCELPKNWKRQAMAKY